MKQVKKNQKPSKSETEIERERERGSHFTRFPSNPLLFPLQNKAVKRGVPSHYKLTPLVAYHVHSEIKSIKRVYQRVVFWV